MDTRLRADLKRGSYCFFVLFGLLTGQLIAQNNLSTDGKLHLVSANGSSISNGSAQDFMLPANIPGLDMLEFILEGGDGGTFHGDNNCNADGGDGSRVTMVFRVGNGANQLKPGGTIRFVVGKHGNSVSGQGGAGGGGGTAVLYLKPGVTSPPATPSTSLSDQNTHWILLGVAGGGGGAQGYFSDNPPSQGGDICHTDAGSGANTGTSGSSGGGSNDGGTGGNGGQTGNDTRDGGAGGGYLTAGDNDAATTKNGKMGGITGGNGGTGSNVVNGGFGYGGGGGGKLGGNGGGGGGGGYSGGGGGNNGSGYANNGGGAGSFVNGDDVGAYRILENLGNTGNPKDGYVKYAYRSSAGPIARCKDVTVTLVNGAYTLEGPEVDNGSSVEPNEDYVFGFRITVGGVQFPVSSLSFDCSDIGVQNRVFRLVSSSGAHDDCTFSLTVKDDVAPVVTCKDVFGGLVAPVGLFDDFQLSVADLEQSSSDACGEIISKTLSQSVFTCADIGAQTVTLTVTDNSGNTGQCAVNVGVVEANNIQYLFCPGDKNITLPAGECTVAVATGLVPLNISGPCSSSLSFQINRIVGGTEQAFDAGPGILSAYEFPAGDFVVRHLITSTGGETVSCSFNVTVAENDPPAALCRDVTVQLDENGDVSIVPGDIDDGSSDACGIQSAVLSQQSFSCADVGVNIVTLTVTDINGNAETCTSSVTIADDDNPCCTPPHAFCQDVTVQLDASGNGSLSANEVDDGSTADCGLQSLGIDITVFDCSDVDSPSAVTLTVTDVNGKASTCTATVTVEDKVPPTPFCRDVTVQLDANGEVSIVTGDIDNGSLDACGIRSVVLSQESFDCGNVGGLNIVALTVTDNSGNILSCFADVTVEDNVSPEALCQDVTVQLDASGTGSVTASDVDDGSSDACGIQSAVLSRQSFSCADVGVNIVTLTVTDINGNAETCTSSVTIADDDNPCCAPPQAFCQDVTVQLDASGNGSLSANEVDDGSTADCGLQSLGIDIIVFDCSDVDSPSAVTLTVTDVNGNASTCTATVKVEDNLPPDLVCQDVTIQLNSDGFKVFNTTTLMDSQSDNCGGVLLSTGNLILNCANVGSFQATLTAEDSHENSTSCTQTVTVEDNVSPVAQCQDITVQLDEEGNAAIGPDDVDNGSSDACGVQSTVLSGQSFSCADVGSNTVTLTVTDVNNNTSTCTATVTVEDNIAPVLNCSDLTVSIENLHGVESVPVYQLYQGGADNCDGAFFPPFEFVEFGCGDVGTTQNLVFSYTDASGNTGACTSVVTIVDNTRPAVSCKNINVSLDENGQAQIAANQVIFSAFDACGIQSRSVSQTDFDCDDIGPNVVQVTVTDNHGNSRSCNATVTVKDAIAPTAVCRDATVQLGPAGQAILTGDDLDNGSFDECGGIQSAIPSQQSFSCGDVGANTVTLTVTDVNNNASTCTATVTVEDNVAPDAVCRNVTVQLDENGAGSTTAAAVDNGSGDACGIQSAVLSRQSFGCADAGANTVTLTVTDVNNNTSTCSATVTVEDNISPIALCNNITVLLDMDGQGEITAAQVDNGSSDACGIQTLALNQTKFDCEQVGTVGVILVATDVNGNASTCSATVTVEDQVNPIALCRDATVQLDANGAGSTTAAAVDNGSSDACGVHSTVLSQQSFSCGDGGANTVTLIVTDVNNNASTCTATVTVEDKVAPDAVCRNVTVQLDENGAGSTTAAAVDNGSGDACGIQSAVLSRQSFSCADMGANTVTLTVTDVNNNASTCSATVTVEDNLDPEVVCSDITVTFNGEGSIGLDPEGIASASDNCAVTGFEAGLPSIACDALGEVVPVTVTVQDAGGNTASCTSHVTVEGLPCGWMSMPDGIGCTNGNEGSFDPDAETFTLLSSGCYTPSATSDESGYIKYQLCGNGTITAHIAGLTLPGYAGIVMRESDAPGAKKVAMAYQGGSAIARYVRYTDNGGAFPSYINAFGARWLRIVRTGNIFRGYYSVNGVTWTYAFAVTVPMDNCIQVGLIAWGTNANSAVTATFDHVVIDPPYGGGMQKGAPGNSVQPVSIAQETAAELWPNPTSGIAMLKLAGSGENEIEVLDDLGRQVIRKRVDAAAESVTELDLSGQAPGMYFVRVKGTDGEAALLRLVVADR